MFYNRCMFTLLTFLAQNSDEASAAAGVAAAGIFGGFILIWIIVGLIGLAFFIWWIVLIIDCINRDFPERTTWLVVLIVGLVFGFVWLVDILYYFLIIKKYENGSKPKKE